MALTPEEKKYVERLIAAGADNENVKFYLNKRRQEEAKMNAPKEQWFLWKTLWFLQWVGSWAIQWGWELAVWLPWQLSRLLPWDQSADPNSFYNKTQNLLESSRKWFEQQWVNTQWVWFWIGKWVINTASASVLWGWVWNLANKSKMLTNLGLKVTSALEPTIAPTSMLWKTALFSAKTLASWAKWASQWLWIDLASWNAPWAWTIAWGTIWLASPTLSAFWWVVWKWVKTAGKALYKTAIKPNTEEASKIIQATAKWFEQPITRADTALKYWIAGTETGLWIKWVKQADTLFKKVINPAFDKAEEQGIKANYSSLVKEAKDNITKSKLYSEVQKKEILNNIDELAKPYKWTTTIKNLDLEKQAIVWKVPKKYIWAIKPPKELTAAQNALSDVFRNTVHKTLKSSFWIDSANLYRDYWNLIQLEKVGIKWLTEWGLRWGTGTMLSTIYDKLATPVKTIWGKYLYKVGKWIEFTWPKGIKTLGDFLRSKWYKVDSNGNLIKYASSALNRSTALLNRSDSWMDRNTLK